MLSVLPLHCNSCSISQLTTNVMDIYWCFSPIESTQPCWYWYGDGMIILWVWGQPQYPGQPLKNYYSGRKLSLPFPKIH